MRAYVQFNKIHTYIHTSNDREQEEDKRELGGWSCKRLCTVEAAYDQNVGSREAEGVMEGPGGPMRGRSKSASPLSRLLCRVSLEVFVIAILIDPS